jgi:hypothetical protein
MEITKADSQKMRRLAQEGKQISKIVAEDFPKLDYWDVYWEVYGSGERSSRGIKRMISNRLRTLIEKKPRSERKAILREIDDLVWHLYENHKQNQQKIGKIRKILGE